MKILTINDISTVGNNSLVATLVVATTLGHQVYPLPSSTFSLHTGFENYKFIKNQKLDDFFESIEQSDLVFDVVHVGFLTDTCQLEAVKRFVQRQKQKGKLTVVDPIMGDNGSFYALYDRDYADKMIELVALADLITPNLTEACLLCGIDYKSQVRNLGSIADVYQLCSQFEKLYNLVPKVVVTSVPLDNRVYNLVYQDQTCHLASNQLVDKFVSGTGDIFTAIVTSLLLNKQSLLDAVQKAGDVVMQCVKNCPNADGRYGVDLSNLPKLLG